jgi:hypothetical protein
VEGLLLPNSTIPSIYSNGCPLKRTIGEQGHENGGIGVKENNIRAGP